MMTLYATLPVKACLYFTSTSYPSECLHPFCDFLDEIKVKGNSEGKSKQTISRELTRDSDAASSPPPDGRGEVASVGHSVSPPHPWDVQLAERAELTALSPQRQPHINSSCCKRTADVLWVSTPPPHPTPPTLPHRHTVKPFTVFISIFRSSSSSRRDSQLSLTWLPVARGRIQYSCMEGVCCRQYGG